MVFVFLFLTYFALYDSRVCALKTVISYATQPHSREGEITRHFLVGFFSPTLGFNKVHEILGEDF